MRKKILSIVLAAIILMTTAMLSSCGEESSDTGSASTATESPIAVSAEDRAARLAAQTQLRNAQMAQEGYFAENEMYASTAGELKSVDPRLNSKIQVVNGSGSGYEISVEASDSAQTIYIIRKSGSKIEHIDGNGNSW